MVNTRSHKKINEPDEKIRILIKQLRKTDPTKAKALLKKLKRKKAHKKIKENVNTVRILGRTEVPHDKKTEQVEYIEEDVDEQMALYFGDVYERFKKSASDAGDSSEELKEGRSRSNVEEYFSGSSSSSDSSSQDDVNSDKEKEDKKREQRLSRKHLKLKNRPSVMKLKEFAEKPELVEIWDTTASDPFFYVWLKCARNSVTVPQHWCMKRKYMHGKRGIEKMPYVLPPYIEDTKISEIRQSIREREEQKSTKQKMRDRVRPKLHTMDIDYQTLHDAFFKYATKPKLVKFGDLYYEGKEMQLQTKKFRPGIISEKLKKALNISENDPIPWIRNMQKYGIPPSFPYLQIKGVNFFPNEEMLNVPASPDGKVCYKYDICESTGSIVYGTFVSVHTFGKYPENFLWGELEKKEEEEEVEEETEMEMEEKKKEKEKVEGEGEGEEEVDEEKADEIKRGKMYGPSSTAEENAYKMANANGTYSVVTNSKMSGTYTPFMEGGLMSVDLTSFIPGYETPKYINPESWNAQNVKPYTVLQTEEVPASQKALFSSNVKYKIDANNLKNNNNTMHRNVNMLEGAQTPFSPGSANTPFTPFENVLSNKEKKDIPHDYSDDTNTETNKQELYKSEKNAKNDKTVPPQVNPVKKLKKEKKKKKEKGLKF